MLQLRALLESSQQPSLLLTQQREVHSRRSYDRREQLCSAFWQLNLFDRYGDQPDCTPGSPYNVETCAPPSDYFSQVNMYSSFLGISTNLNWQVSDSLGNSLIGIMSLISEYSLA